MLTAIQNTIQYGKLEKFQQELVSKKANRAQIEEAVITARAITYEVWVKSSKFSSNWNNIVKELI